jgi:hypothetical protein
MTSDAVASAQWMFVLVGPAHSMKMKPHQPAVNKRVAVLKHQLMARPIVWRRLTVHRYLALEPAWSDHSPDPQTVDVV